MTDNSHRTALVVDNDHRASNQMAELLVKEGFVVKVADNQDSAQSLLSDLQVDILFSALDDDAELLSHAIATNASVRVVTLVDAGDQNRIALSLQAGAYDYLEKPLDDLMRIQSVVRKTQENITLTRDNAVLISHLESSHTRLASANAKLAALDAKLQTLTVTDNLTGIHNRSYIDSVLAQEFDRFERYRDPFSVLLLDIDNFNSPNTNNDHEFSELALQHVANIVQRNGRNTDTVARYGDAKFILLLTRTPAENAGIVGERLRSAIEEAPVVIDGTTTTLTICAGLAGASSSEPVGSLTELLARCDEALLRAKASGPNQVCVYGDDQEEEEFDPQAWSGRAA